MSLIGARIGRLEDAALLAGRGRFLDDLAMEGTLECAFVRSADAHARIDAIHTEEARRAPGVVAVYTLGDLRPHLTSERLPLGFAPEQGDRPITPFVLAGREVCYVGEAIAVVVAENRYLAEDAAQLVLVDATPLPAVADARAALAPGSPPVHTDTPTNLIRAFAQSYGDVDAAFAGAPHTVSLSLRQHRGAAHPMEGRGVLARFDPVEDRLTVWSSTQMSHEVRAGLVRLLGLDEDRLRVLAPDVGGGFGCKFLLYPEEVVIALAARLLGRPVKWVEDRREHFLASIQERDQYWDLDVAFEADGRIRGMRGTMIHDQGAYTPQGFNLAYNASTASTGVYVVPALDLRVSIAETNKVPTIPVRGAGYPQGNFAIERALDRIADTLGLGRAEVRARNMVAAAQMPYETPMRTRSGAPVRFDSGDFPAAQARALALIDAAGLPARKEASRARGLRRGLGIANGIKGTGRGPFETGLVRVGRSGRITAFTGALAMGQGLQTAFAQIVADALGVQPGEVTVVAGDTATVSMGQGGFASRQTVTAGSALALAAAKVRAKALALASHLLEVPEDRLTLADGQIRPLDGSNRALSLKEAAEALAGVPGYALPGGIEPGLEAEAHFMPTGLAYAHGCHAVELEVDPETGAVQLLRYVVVNDAGRLVNPTIVEGQLHGGVVHGIGNALFEEMRFDEHAQPVSTNFGEYLLPSATEVPMMEIHHMESPSPLNPLGVKGVGEAGVLPVAPAIVSAIEDALSDLGVRIDAYPVTPMRIVELIAAASPR